MRLATVALCAALGAGCGRCSGPRPPEARAAPRAVALVNGEPIAADALARELRDAQAGSAGADGNVDVLRRRILDELVERALLLQQAKARGVVVGQDLVERELLRVRADYPGTQFDDLLARERVSQPELKLRLRDQLTLERLFEGEVFPGVQVAAADVERYYAEHAGEFQEPEAVHVLQVVVASKDEAAQVRDRLKKNPQTFADVAKKSSIAPEAKNGGDLGLIGKGSGFPEVFDVCFSLQVNTISDVTPSPYGFHIFKVTERRPAQQRPLAQAAAGIREKLLQTARGKAQADYVQALRQRAHISIDDQVLASVNP